MLNVFQKSVGLSAAVAAAAAMMVPAAPAAAQSYYGDRYDNRYDDGRYYDRCDTYRDGRTGAGALVGGGLGAVAGSQLAARGRRTEGSILGGVVGAVIGGSVGRSSADNCGDRYRSDYSYDRYGYGDRYRDDYRREYDNRYYGDRSYDGGYYGNRYSDRGYADRYYSSGSYGYGYQNGYRYDCRRVESTTRDWNGRLVTTYREVC